MADEIRKQVEEILGHENPDALFLDGFDAAIVGISHRCAQPSLVVYDYDLMHKDLVEHQGMTEEEAHEYLDFNVLGAWVGENTPIVLVRPSAED